MTEQRDGWTVQTPPEPEKDGASDGSTPTVREIPPPAPPFSWPTSEEPPKHEFHHPLDRVTGGLPRRLRIAVDWIVTIVGRDRDRPCDQGVGRESVPHPVVVDGVHASLRPAGGRV